jgi:ribonuclease HI
MASLIHMNTNRQTLEASRLANMIRAQSLWYEHAANAVTMETMAIRVRARLVVERGYNQVIIESDSQLAVNLCNGGDHNRSKIMSICQEFREIGRAFSSCSIIFVGREANLAAHLYANKASVDRRRCL